MNDRAPVNLTGVPETMLWTLYNRAHEARRGDGLLHDPACVRIFEAIDYDFARSFGAPDSSHPVRSRSFDAIMRPWIAAHPGGAVVELGAGLETQFSRLDDGRVHWLCVDVPESIAVRERFLPASERCRHLGVSALDLTWLDAVDGSRGVFVSAQGLFMYFEEAEVRRLLTAIIERFPGVEILFDTIPPWFSRKTLKGFQKTRFYRAPPMPWGVRRDALPSLLRSWSPRVRDVELSNYGVYARGLFGALLRGMVHVPRLRDLPPAIVHVKTHTDATGS